MKRTATKDLTCSGNGWKKTKVTKRAKSIDVICRQHVVIESISSYTCPSCHIEFVGCGPDKSTTRFICECGQELIVRNRMIVKEG